jgi:hypothetical protein
LSGSKQACFYIEKQVINESETGMKIPVFYYISSIFSMLDNERNYMNERIKLLINFSIKQIMLSSKYIDSTMDTWRTAESSTYSGNSICYIKCKACPVG